MEQDARRDLTLRSELLAHPARRGVTGPCVRLRASARAVRSDCRAPTVHGEARWSLASDVVVVRSQVQVLLSGVFQRVSSDSPASCRSVRRVKQTWIRGPTRECTGAAIVLGAQELNRPGDPYTARLRDTRFVTAFATCANESSAPAGDARPWHRKGDVAVDGTPCSRYA